MSCFDNVITVKGGCNPVDSTSGYYINSLVSLDELNAFVQKDYADGEALAVDKINFAISQIQSTIYSHFAHKYKANSLLDGMRVGFSSDNLQSISGTANTYKGINLELCNTQSFLDVHISTLSLQLNVTQSVDVKVIDLISGKIIDTITVSAVSGKIVTVTVGKTYKADRRRLNLIFVYDTTGINSYKHTINNTGGCSDCGGNMYSNSYITYRGINIPTASSYIKSNLDTQGDTAGMSIVYSVSCNHSDWLCTFSNLIALPILYKAAAEIMEYARLQSGRSNSKTFINEEKLKERQDLYEFKYREQLDNIIKNIKLPSDRQCFECNPLSKHAIMLP